MLRSNAPQCTRRRKIKLRIIILTLALLSFLSTAIGGYLYYSSSREYAYGDAYEKADVTLRITANRIISRLAEHQKVVRALAGLNDIINTLAREGDVPAGNADSMLDHFHYTMEVDVCYLMNSDGYTLASSNRSEPDSFVGENYSFRPYFMEAMQGRPSIYMALGVTSKKRGIYFSHPVYGHERGRATGVVVIKSPIDKMEDDLREIAEGTLLLTGPHGVVFATNRDDWLYHVLWEVSQGDLNEIKKSQQFGAGPWQWTGMKRISPDHAVDGSGIEYIIRETNIENYPGWNVVYLWKLKTITDNFITPLIRTAGNIILALCIFIGVGVTILYKKASRDIAARKIAEDKLSSAYGELEARVLERTADLKNANEKLKVEIEERRQVEEQLLHAQKMEAVGQLAGGVAHEFNNILTAILNNIYIAQRRTKDDDPTKEILDKMLTLSLNAARVAQELLAFSRKHHINPSPVRLNDIVKRTESLLNNFIGEDITLKVSLTDRDPLIMADKGQIEQVIVNLAANARDAMPKGGMLSIETDMMEIDEGFVKSRGFGAPGIYALLSIRDTGTGIEKEIMQKIFEPFFTTKDVGKGTGLGLAIAYGIITQHKGYVSVRSSPGEGAEFSIFLPQISGERPAVDVS